MLLLKSLIVWSTLELGVIPGHDLSLYQVPEHHSYLNVDQTFYADYDVRVKLFRHLRLHGGATLYSFKNANDALSFYPFRADYQAGAAIVVDMLEVGVDHGCYHTVSPNNPNIPLPMLDAAQERFYIKLYIGRER